MRIVVNATVLIALTVSSGYASSVEAASRLGSGNLIEVKFEADAGSFVLEVDGIDVTSLADWTSTSVSYTPTPTLSVGVHTIRVSRIQGEQTIILYDQSVTVEALGLQLDADAHANYQTTREIGSDPNANGANNADTGDLALTSVMAFDDTRLTLNTSANYSGDGVNGSSPNIDLADWAATVTVPTRFANFGLKGGTHSSDIDSLIIGAQSTRGITLSATSKDQAYRFGGFARSTTPTTGSRNFFGLDLPQDQVAGAEVSVRLLETLQLQSTVYTGERGSRAKGLADITGEGWSLALDKFSEDQKFHARAEYARTSADTDGPAGDAPSRNDRAIILSADYQAIGETGPDGRNLQLSFRGEFSTFGSNFLTLAKSSAAPDQTQLVLGSSLLFGQFSMDTELKRASDNVNDLEGLPTNVIDSITASFGYQAPGENGGAGLNWTGGFSIQDASMKDLPQDFPPEEQTNTLLTSINVGASGQLSTIGWSITHTLSVFEDLANSDQDFVENVTQMSATYRLEPFQIQTGLLHNYRGGNASTSADLSPTFAINGTFLEDRITLAASYGGRLPYRTARDDSQTVSANVSAVLVKPQEFLPGLTLNLGYAYNAQSAFPVPRQEVFFGSIQFSR